MDSMYAIKSFQEVLENFREAILAAHVTFDLSLAEIAELDPELAEALLDEPEELLRAANKVLEDMHEGYGEGKPRLRISSLPKHRLVYISQIRSKHVGQLVAVPGLIIQATDVRPMVISIVYECPSCGSHIPVIERDRKIKAPGQCSCGRKGHFRILEQTRSDTQKLLIQEDLDDLEGSVQPKRLYVFLKDDLTTYTLDKLHAPGNRVSIIGIIREIEPFGKNHKDTAERELVIEANNIVMIQEEFETMKINEHDKAEILTLAQKPNLKQELIASVAPNIEGHEILKEGILLSMVGGVGVNSESMHKRGSIHMLMLGDPGTAKSQLLHSAFKIAPKGRMAGTGSTGVGLTASVRQDQLLGQWVLEAGDLVLADKGVLFWDEADKLPEDDAKKLHEALSDEKVYISKANIHTTLNARTTVIAAANPKFGIFNEMESIASQFPLSPSMMDRFDLTFVLKDRPEREKDRRVIQRIFESKKLKGNFETPIGQKLLKKFLAYAKQNVHPSLPCEVEDDIMNFFVELRNQGYGDRAISNRVADAVVKLTEAQAKLRLADVATLEDSANAKRVYMVYLNEVGLNRETGKIESDTLAGTIALSKRNVFNVVKEILNALFGDERGKQITLDLIFEQTGSKGISNGEVWDILDKMRINGDIFEPRRGVYQRQ